jgi:hypothetical protein
MALTFPSSPTNGQIYTDTVTGYRYSYNSSAGVWSFAANSVGMSVSSTPPSNVAPGAMWFNREIGRTFVYYDDGDSKQWIETVPATGSFDGTLVSSYANTAAVLAVAPAYNTANAAYASQNADYTTTNAAFSKANNALSNTSGVSFAGDLYVPTYLGIGTNGPSTRLDVQQASSVPTFPVRVLYNSPSVTYANTQIVVQNMNGATGDKALYGAMVQATGGNGYNPVGFGAIQTDYSNRYSAFVVYVSSSDNFSVASHERMRIDNSGNVGLGTSAPQTNLHIYGSSKSGMRMVGGTANSDLYQRHLCQIDNIYTWTTLLSITPSTVGNTWMRGFVKCSISCHNSGNGNGALIDAIWYLDLNGGSGATTAQVSAGTTSGSWPGQFRVNMSGNIWQLQVQSTNTANRFDGVAMFDILLSHGAGTAATFTIA